MLFLRKQPQESRTSEPSDNEFVDQMIYIDNEASSSKWLMSIIPPWKSIKDYIISLFPFFTWIYRYNWVWFIGDMIAGITVGVVVIPQGMAYAKLAQLPPEFGLYSSFVGCILYFIFATSKDITIGPVAVMSTIIGHIIQDTLPELPQYEDKPWVIAGCLSVILGCIITALGLLRLGFIIDFIPLPAIAAFITGSSLNIAMGQIPALMGNKGVEGFNTNDPAYLVFINFFKYIKHCNINAAVGITSLFLLYFIRWSCNYIGRRWPRYERVCFFLNISRTAFVILLYTLISYLVNRGNKEDPKFSIIGNIPVGLKHMGVPTVNNEILSVISSRIPASIIVLVIEHISIAKSFGRINNYTINPNQELIAIGITNIFGPFFGGYPATGSFTRTAIKSKAGVRTPLAGFITGVAVIVAIYALPPVFYYISNAVLAAVIIHAVGDLISSPSTIKSFWKVSPFEFIIFWIGVIVSIFSSIDNGIYATVAASAALMLFRIAKANGKFIGYVKVHEQKLETGKTHGSCLRLDTDRRMFVPLDYSDGMNPRIRPESPGHGIFIYRINECFLYPNAIRFTDHIVEQIITVTRPGILNPYGTLGNRPWNDPGPRHKTDSDIDPTLPELRAIILDLSGVSNVDVTSVQNLADVRMQLNKHANCSVGWYFSGIKSPWIRRALINGGFGNSDSSACTVFSVAGVSIPTDEGGVTMTIVDEEKGFEGKGIKKIAMSSKGFDTLTVPLLPTNYPRFYGDLDSALRAAEEDANSNNRQLE